MTASPRIRLGADDLDRAAAAGLLRPDQVAPLWTHLLARARAAPDDRPRFSFTHVLYYLGGMLAIGAMSLFMTLGWASFGGWGVFFIALLYIGWTHPNAASSGLRLIGALRVSRVAEVPLQAAL
jgi:hypothetical protein